MHLARALGVSLAQVLSMTNYEVQLWLAYLFPDPDLDTTTIEGLCD